LPRSGSLGRRRTGLPSRPVTQAGTGNADCRNRHPAVLSGRPQWLKVRHGLTEVRVGQVPVRPGSDPTCADRGRVDEPGPGIPRLHLCNDRVHPLPGRLKDLQYHLNSAENPVFDLIAPFPGRRASGVLCHDRPRDADAGP
jgi:hypothetical protein